MTNVRSAIDPLSAPAICRSSANRVRAGFVVRCVEGMPTSDRHRASLQHADAREDDEQQGQDQREGNAPCPMRRSPRDRDAGTDCDD